MNLYYFGSALNLSSLYMVAGCGAALSIKSGEFNLGGEGQIYFGGFISALLLVKLSFLPSPVLLPLVFISAFLCSGFLTTLSAFFKKYRHADFLFTSYIISPAVIPFIDGLISGPFRSHTDNLLATPFIAQKFRLSSILKPSPLNPSFFIALAFCLVFFFLIYRTSFGRKLCIYGISPRFAAFAGYRENSLTLTSALVSGGMHGLCGALAVTGTYYTCHLGFYSGMGWNAFSTALIASSNPLLIIPSSLFMGFITTYSNKYALYHNFGFDMSTLLQAFILLVISFLIHKKDDK